MPQSGLHGWVGIKTSRFLGSHLPSDQSKFILPGVVLGAVLPDIDLYPAALAYLIGRSDLVSVLHRTATHSLLLVMAFALAGRIGGKTPRSLFCRGIALGLLTHLFLDLFLWFSPIDLFWPLSHIPAGHPLLPVVNLWAGVHLPPVFGRTAFIPNLLAAGEFAALSLYLNAIRKMRREISGGSSVSREESRRVQIAADQRLTRWIGLSWAAFAIALAGVFTLSQTAQQVLVSVPCLLWFMPYSVFEAMRCVVEWEKSEKRSAG